MLDQDMPTWTIKQSRQEPDVWHLTATYQEGRALADAQGVLYPVEPGPQPLRALENACSREAGIARATLGECPMPGTTVLLHSLFVTGGIRCSQFLASVLGNLDDLPLGWDLLVLREQEHVSDADATALGLTRLHDVPQMLWRKPSPARLLATVPS